MKKTFISITAVMVALSVITVCAFAAPEKNDKKGAPNRGEGRENFQSESAEGQRPEHMNGDKMPARGDNSFDFNDIGEMIEQKLESVTDEEIKANLESLLEAYNTAAEAVQTAIDNKSDDDSVKALREACETAKKAFTDALKEAGIETGAARPDNDVKRDRNDKGDKGGRGFNSDEFAKLISEKLEAVADSDVKANIESLLEAYNTAAEAVQTAIDNNSDDDSVKALREACETAKKALTDALKEAGIESDVAKPDNDGKKERSDKADKSDKIELSENAPASEENAPQNEGFFSKIASWFGGLFK